MNENNFMLPPNWVRASISDVSRYFRGVSYQKSDAASVPTDEHVPVLRANNLDAGFDLRDLVYVPLHCVTDEQFVRANDIVLAMSSGSKKHVGKAVLATAEMRCAFGAFCGLLRPKEGIVPKFLSLQLQGRSFRRYIEDSALGTNINNLKSSDLLAYEIVLAPLSEQRRIVAKIEELFSELDKGIESLSTARQQLELFRLTILHQALVDDDGATFPVVALEKLIGEIGQGWSPKCDVNTPPIDGEWAIIKTTAVQPMAYLPHECKPLPDALKPRPSIEIRDGDLLMTRKGPRPRTGVVCHVRKARPHSMLCDTVYRFRAREEVVLPEFLEIALNAPAVVQEINARKSGISESGISLNHGKLHSLLIPVPSSLTEQARIVQLVRERMSVIEHQISIIAEQFQRVESLQYAILQRAFSGRLVSQDLTDEQASVLLERIRAEHEGGSGTKRRNNKNGKKEAA